MRELRCIIFEESELIKALVGYRRRTGKPLPPGQIGRLEIEKSPEIAARLNMCFIPDDHISPRRSALFMARSVLRDIRDGAWAC